MDTAFKGYFFLFLASSLIYEVGSEPGDKMNRISFKVLDTFQVLYIE